MNIGKTDRDVRERVAEQTRQWTVEPRIDLVLKTNQPKDLETKIHGLLKALDRHLNDFKGSGNEWYNVAPDEMVYLYKRVILRFKYYHIRGLR